MSRKSYREAFAKLDALYARLPTIQCQGRCALACGPIPLTDLEAQRLKSATHQTPRTVPDNRCVYLSPAGRCRAYAARPLICRAYGLLQGLCCPHGCVPDRWLTEKQFLELAVAIERVGGGRVIRTTDDGLAAQPGESFRAIATRVALVGHRPIDEMEANAARTRALRALHGGRVLAAVKDP